MLIYSPINFYKTFKAPFLDADDVAEDSCSRWRFCGGRSMPQQGPHIKQTFFNFHKKLFIFRILECLFRTKTTPKRAFFNMLQRNKPKWNKGNKNTLLSRY
jgi:hypothetical protein